MKEKTSPECQRDVRARDWWWSQARSGEIYSQKRRRCCGHWHALRPLHFRESCVAAHEELGSDGGVVFDVAGGSSGMTAEHAKGFSLKVNPCRCLCGWHRACTVRGTHDRIVRVNHNRVGVHSQIGSAHVGEKQFSRHAKEAMVPVQYAWKIPWCECVAHVFQALTDSTTTPQWCQWMEWEFTASFL